MDNSPEPTIRGRIASQGKITFAEFMELALYHAQGGYYTTPSAFGAQGDYFTSPAAHPAFGALIAIQLQRMWEVLDRPSQFVVVEMGAGSGLLARDVVGYAAGMSASFAQSLRYMTLERYALPGEARPPPNGIYPIITRGVPLKEVVGCFISNEIVDSFPVHRFQIHQRAVTEIYVSLDEHGRLTDVLDQPSTPLLAQRLDGLGLSLPEGFLGEVNLRIGPWMNEVSTALGRGFVVTIDYGHEAGELYSHKRAKGTLQTHYRHTRGGSPYQHMGWQDITAHVDFSSVAAEGSSLGLQSLGLTTQSRFLKTLGFDAMLERLKEKKLSQGQRDANMLAMLELVKAEGLGGFSVLVQERATGVKDLGQLAPTTSAGDIEAPVLRPDHMPLMEGRYPHLAWEPEDLWPFGERRP